MAAGMKNIPPAYKQLSPAEVVVLAYVRLGLSNREIATALGKSERTVKNQVSAVLAKFGIPTRARLIALSLRRASHCLANFNKSESVLKDAIPIANLN